LLPGVLITPPLMPISPSVRAIRDVLELQSAAERFFGALARRVSDPATRALLEAFTRDEHQLVLDVRQAADAWVKGPVPEPTGRAADVKTAPAWGLVSEPTFDHVLAIAVDCLRRAASHHEQAAATVAGPVSVLLREMAASQGARASKLEVSLDREVRARFAGHAREDVLNETLDAVVRAGDRFRLLARRCPKQRTASFLAGMVEVCSLHATSVRALVADVRALREADRAHEDLLAPTMPIFDGGIDALDFLAAMRMAMHAEQRASLVHGMQARAFSGEIRDGLERVAEAESGYASTISTVLDRVVEHEEDRKRSGIQASPELPGRKRTLRLVVG